MVAAPPRPAVNGGSPDSGLHETDKPSIRFSERPETPSPPPVPPNCLSRSHDRQYDGSNNTNTGMISIRPTHMSTVIATFVDHGNGS